MVLEGGHLRPSQNAYDWLGHGIYFWEDSPARAMRWATEMPTVGAPVGKPAVLGAIIDTGHCLSLIDPENASLVTNAYTDYVELCQKAGLRPLENKGPESKARFLDCSVMNLLHELREKEGHRPFDTVRGFFIEEIEAQRVFLQLDFAQQTVPQKHPFLLAHLALEHGFLDARAVVLTGLGHAPKAAQARLFHGGDVVGDKDEHG